jgi:hypothetical protein
MLEGTSLGRLVALLAVAVVIAHARPASADRVDDLAKLLTSSSDKTRLSAVVSLARLGDKRTLKPLVTALEDPSPQVRAMASTALGKLGHKAALPSLRNAALNDPDHTVRNTARTATLQVAKINKLPHGLPEAPAPEVAPVQMRKRTTGFGRSPQAVEDRPDLYVTIKNTNDDSPGKADKATRKAHADIVKQALNNSLRTAGQVTMLADDAARWGLDQRAIDVSVVKLDVVTAAGYVEVAAELRVAISDHKGRMISFLSGGAKVQIPQKKFNPRYLGELRKEALESAMRGMFDKLLGHLRKIATA